MPTLLPIVNVKDEVIGVKSRKACGPDDITRVSGLFVYNAKGEILLARRVMTKQYDPGKWSMAVNGTVEDGETYLSNILKETEEEIGLTLAPEDVHEAYHGYFETSHKFFYTQFTVEIDCPISDLKRQIAEVEELRYVPAEDLWRWIDERPDDFVHSFSEVTALLRGSLGWQRS